ncbi:MAG: hypothetical protein AB2812_09635 [Candidatus Sedimenticola endophacoides]
MQARPDPDALAREPALFHLQGIECRGVGVIDPLPLTAMESEAKAVSPR